MRVPLGWLRSFVDLPADAHAVAQRLAMLGFPVEDVTARPTITGVVAGRIVALEKHPNADRLSVARVDVGDRVLTIATAATNVAAGQTIGVATIGARLPQLTITPRTMRGVTSEGMMVSADELALPAEWFEDGILQIDANVVLGTDVIERFELGQPVLDVEITSNRPDVMSMIGLARELAASYDKPIRLPSFDNPGDAGASGGGVAQPAIDSPDCTRFIAQRFDNVTVGIAPLWMRVRLALAGQRPINDIVDVSNYVMLETGQPLHFYDAARVRGALRARDARKGERLVTLDGVERTLQPRALAIADDDGALGLAGVMGGASSEVSASTTAIVLESANFNGARIRRTSAELALRSEASSRHEKTLAPALADAGAARAAQLLVALGARAGRPRIAGDDPAVAEPIALHASDVERLLGLALPVQRVAHHLEALGCAVAHGADGTLAVTPPAWRRDLTCAADLVEEVARMEGYDRIEALVPDVPPQDIASTQFDLENRIARALAALGYDEIITHSLHGRQLFDRALRAGMAPSHQSVEVRNPLSEETRYLRYALAPGLLDYLAPLHRPARVFEIGHVFMLDEGHIAEVAAATFGFSVDSGTATHDDWRDPSFLRLKGDCEMLVELIAGCAVEATPDVRNGLHPGKTAVLMHEGREVAALGRLDPRLARTYDLDVPVYLCNIYLDALPEPRTPHYAAPSRFPSTYRDLALVLPLDAAAATVERVVARTLGALCTSVRAFDEYRGPQVPPDRKSLAVRVVLQRFDATITDEEADAAVARVLGALRDELSAVVRQ